MPVLLILVGDALFLYLIFCRHHVRPFRHCIQQRPSISQTVITGVQIEGDQVDLGRIEMQDRKMVDQIDQRLTDMTGE